MCDCKKAKPCKDWKEAKSLWYRNYQQGQWNANEVTFLGPDGISGPTPAAANVDGTISDGQEGLTLDSQVFAAATPASATGDTRHVHLLVYYNKIFEVPNENGMIYYEASISAEQFLGQPPTAVGGRYNNAEDDLFFPFGALNMFDLEESAMVFDATLQNQAIQALYERLAFRRGQGNQPVDYASFTSTDRIASRGINESGDTGLDDFAIIGIGYNRHERWVKWYINREEVFMQTRIGNRADPAITGIDRGGNDYNVRPNQVQVGFGNFDLQDRRLNGNYVDNVVTGPTGMYQLNSTPNYYYNPLPVQNGDIVPVAPGYFINTAPTLADMNFGQGVITRVRWIHVMWVPCGADWCEPKVIDKCKNYRPCSCRGVCECKKKEEKKPCCGSCADGKKCEGDKHGHDDKGHGDKGRSHSSGRSHHRREPTTCAIDQGFPCGKCFRCKVEIKDPCRCGARDRRDCRCGRR